jgi:hypothetical protein
MESSSSVYMHDFTDAAWTDRVQQQTASRKERVLLLGQASRQGSIIYTGRPRLRRAAPSHSHSHSGSLTHSLTQSITTTHLLTHAHTHTHLACSQDAVALLLASDQLDLDYRRTLHCTPTGRAATSWSCRAGWPQMVILLRLSQLARSKSWERAAQCDSLAANFVAAATASSEPRHPWPGRGGWCVYIVSVCECECECARRNGPGLASQGWFSSRFGGGFTSVC